MSKCLNGYSYTFDIHCNNRDENLLKKCSNVLPVKKESSTCEKGNYLSWDSLSVALFSLNWICTFHFRSFYPQLNSSKQKFVMLDVFVFAKVFKLQRSSFFSDMKKVIADIYNRSGNAPITYLIYSYNFKKVYDFN